MLLALSDERAMEGMRHLEDKTGAHEKDWEGDAQMSIEDLGDSTDQLNICEKAQISTWQKTIQATLISGHNQGLALS